MTTGSKLTGVDMLKTAVLLGLLLLILLIPFLVDRRASRDSDSDARREAYSQYRADFLERYPECESAYNVSMSGRYGCSTTMELRRLNDLLEARQGE